jgi:glycosyltransferase involved in cell wall biosynthesis
VLQVSRLHMYLTYPFVLSWSMLEAMAVGCVVLGSDTEPVREFIRDGHNGLLTPFFDLDALRERAVSVLSNPGQFQRLGERARAGIVRDFDFERAILPRHLALLDGLDHY